MSWDLEASLKRALVKQQWVFGDRYFRLGNPFIWVDGSIQLSPYDYRGIVDLAQWYSGYYEEYQTPSRIKTENYDVELSTIENIYRDIFNSYFPFIDRTAFDADLYIRCHALTRMQDYCMLHKFATDLLPQHRKTNSSQMKHLDFGAGMGGNATYSNILLEASYTAIEAHQWSYDIQRMFFGKMADKNRPYLDVLAAESMEIGSEKLKNEILSNKYAIKQIPSWFFEEIEDNSYNLVTATNVLNELNTSAIIYMLTNSNRVLQENGYIYIRDSGKLKPGRHLINYDQVLIEHMGFELIHWLDVQNRVDMYAVPRIYKKVRNVELSFDELFYLLINREATLAQGLKFAQNLKT